MHNSFPSLAFFLLSIACSLNANALACVEVFETSTSREPSLFSIGPTTRSHQLSTDRNRLYQIESKLGFELRNPDDPQASQLTVKIKRTEVDSVTTNRPIDLAEISTIQFTEQGQVKSFKSEGADPAFDVETNRLNADYELNTQRRIVVETEFTMDLTTRELNKKIYIGANQYLTPLTNAQTSFIFKNRRTSSVTDVMVTSFGVHSLNSKTIELHWSQIAKNEDLQTSGQLWKRFKRQSTVEARTSGAGSLVVLKVPHSIGFETVLIESENPYVFKLIQYNPETRQILIETFSFNAAKRQIIWQPNQTVVMKFEQLSEKQKKKWFATVSKVQRLPGT